jgi:hypothetical protein
MKQHVIPFDHVEVAGSYAANFSRYRSGSAGIQFSNSDAVGGSAISWLAGRRNAASRFWNTEAQGKAQQNDGARIDSRRAVWVIKTRSDYRVSNLERLRSLSAGTM